MNDGVEHLPRPMPSRPAHTLGSRLPADLHVTIVGTVKPVRVLGTLNARRAEWT